MSHMVRPHLSRVLGSRVLGFVRERDLKILDLAPVPEALFTDTHRASVLAARNVLLGI